MNPTAWLISMRSKPERNCKTIPKYGASERGLVLSFGFVEARLRMQNELPSRLP